MSWSSSLSSSPPSHAPRPPHPRHNPLGAAALTAALIGCGLSIVPGAATVALLLGVAAAGLGIVARVRAHRRLSGNGPAAGVGVLLGAFAVVLGTVAAVAAGPPAQPAAASPAPPSPGAGPGRMVAAAATPQGRAAPLPTAARTRAPAVTDQVATGPAAPVRIDGRGAYGYTDGLRVAVSAVDRVRFSASSTAGPRRGAAVTVRIDNGTAGAVDLEFVRVVLRYGGERAESIFDYRTGFTGGFTGRLEPGGTVTARFGFAVPAGAHPVAVEVSPGWYYDPTTFVGRIAA